MGFFDRLLEGEGQRGSPYIPDIPDEEGYVRYRLTFSGQVQGVGFRWTMQMYAREQQLTGWVHNNYDGTVVSEVQGPVNKIRLLMYQIQEGRYIRVDHIDAERISTDAHESTFTVK